MINILDIIKADHRAVEEIFLKLEKTTERATKIRDELFHELKRDLEAHSSAEEKVLYQSIISKKPSRKLVLESIEEHNLVSYLLASLAINDKSDEHWMAKLGVLKSLVSRHVLREEKELFTKARGIFNARELVDLGVRMQAQKEEFLNPSFRPAHLKGA